jgi:hypothetical protein
MAGTFCSADVLVVEAVRGDVRAGDVVVFAGAGGRRIAHRVRACLSDRLVTQGDALSEPDAGLVAVASLEGRVVDVWRGRACVCGGPAAGATILAAARRLLRPAYRRASAQPWLRRALRALLRPELRTLRSFGPSGAPVITITHRGRTIAWMNPRRGGMSARFPWALILDPPGPAG